LAADMVNEMIEMARKSAQKSFQRVDVEELERLLKLSSMKDEKPVKRGFFAMLKEFFKRH